MKSLSLFALIVAMLVFASGAGAQAVYTFDSSTEGWTDVGAGGGMSNFRAEGGALQWDYITATNAFDPIVQGPGGLSVDTVNNHWLRIDVEITTPAAAPDQTFQVFFDDGNADGNGGFNEPDSRTFTVTPNAGVVTVVFDMNTVQATRDAFSGIVTNFRIDPGNSATDLVGGTGTIDLIALTSDTDFDSIPDDKELQYFGDLTTADQSTDFDSDGLPDWQEIAIGSDPTVGNGAAGLPLGGTAYLVIALGLLGTGFIARRRYLYTIR